MDVTQKCDIVRGWNNLACRLLRHRRINGAVFQNKVFKFELGGKITWLAGYRLPWQPNKKSGSINPSGIFSSTNPLNYETNPTFRFWVTSVLVFSQSEALHGYHGNQNQTMYRFWIFGIWAFIWYITLHNWVLASGWKRLAKIWAPNTRPPLKLVSLFILLIGLPK